VYISFLSHEYTDDGVHMTLDFPAAGGVSPPIVIRYGEMPQSVAVETVLLRLLEVAAARITS
jgi:hypothetical protein